jgi:quercetin dioxygenase-like cupin family protein
MEREMEGRTPSIIDLNAELAKLTMFRGLTPQTTRAERRGSGTQLGPYRDGILIAGKSAGTSHWETHPQDELVHVLEGRKTLEIVCDDGPPKSFVLRAGMMAVVPQGAWHRFHSAEGGTTWSATLPGDHLSSMSTTLGRRGFRHKHDDRNQSTFHSALDRRGRP